MAEVKMGKEGHSFVADVRVALEAIPALRNLLKDVSYKVRIGDDYLEVVFDHSTPLGAIKEAADIVSALTVCCSCEG